MKILILGGDGMLGHQLLLSLSVRHDVRVTLRQDSHAYTQYHLFNSSNSYFGVDIRRDENIQSVLSDFEPQAVINAVGIVKQRKFAKEAIPSIEINALFPHRLALLCEKVKARMVHISTDCIFSGEKGRYVETDFSDAKDLYGKSKHLGEVQDSHCITLRSSIIGLELSRKTSLIEWFLAQQGTIKGFKRAIYSGVTTQEMSRVIERVLLNHSHLSGVFHVSSDFITKYDLLIRLNDMLGGRDISIEPDNDFFCDRSLISDVFYDKTGYRSPSWEMMLRELVEQIKQRSKRSTLCTV